MNHQVIEQQNLADRYVMGKLTAAEQTTFEEHFIDCAECLDRIEAIESFRRGILTVATEEAAKTRAVVQLGLLARLVRVVSRHPVLMTAMLLLILLPLALFFSRLRISPQSDSGSIKTDTADLQHRLDEQRQDLEKLQQQMQESQQQWSKERKELENQIAQAKPREAPAKGVSNIGAIPVFSLDAARSADQNQPTSQIVVSRWSPVVVLYLELEPDDAIVSYRAALTAPGNQTLWKQDKLKMNTREGIILSLNSGLLKSGDHLLTLEGLTARGTYVPVKRFPFRINIRK